MYKKLKLIESAKLDEKLNSFEKNTFSKRILDAKTDKDIKKIVYEIKRYSEPVYTKCMEILNGDGSTQYKAGQISDILYQLNESENLKEADDDIEDIQDKAEEDLENEEELEDTIDDEQDQEENPIEEETELDKELNELRDILVDLDLNLYQITDKEDLNNSVYIIGKVAEDSDDVLMLVDTQPEEVNSEEIPEEEPIIDNIDVDDNINESAEVVKVLRNPKNSNERVEIKKLPNGKYQTLYYSDEKSFSGAQSQFDDLNSAIKQAQKLRPTYKLDEAEDLENNEETEEDEHKTELEQRFDFVKLPNSFEEVNKLNPRYGEELTPDHEAIVEYLMNCLIELNPEAAEELQKEDNEEPPIESEEDIDLDIDIDGEEDLEDED